MMDIQPPSSPEKFDAMEETTTSTTVSSTTTTLSTSSETTTRSSNTDIVDHGTDDNTDEDVKMSSTTKDNNDQDQDGMAVAEDDAPPNNINASTAAATFPKQIGNAWGTNKPPTTTATTPNPTTSSSNPKDDMDSNSSTPNNSKKRPKLQLGGEEKNNQDESKNKLNNFFHIMAEQEDEKKKKEESSTRGGGGGTKGSVSFCKNQIVVESEEDRMMRLAIEASLFEHQQDGYPSNDTKMPASALKGKSNSDGDDDDDDDAKMSSFGTKGNYYEYDNTKKQIENHLGYGNYNQQHGNDNEDDDGMDEDMRMAIALSLQEAKGGGSGGGDNNGGFVASTVAASAASTSTGVGYTNSFIALKQFMKNEFSEVPTDYHEKSDWAEDYYEKKGDGAEGGISNFSSSVFDAAAKKAPSPSIVSTFDAFPAVVAASKKPPPSSFDATPSAVASKPPPSFDDASSSATIASKPPPSCAASSSASVAAAATATASSKPPPPSIMNDGSESLARALHEAELAEYDASKSASAAAEMASLKLAMALQEEEDAARNCISNNRDAVSQAAGLLNNVGVRTVGREEFHSLKMGGKDDYGMVGRRKHEERDVGKLLVSSNSDSYGKEEGDATTGDVPMGDDDDTDNYYYYADDRLKSDDAQHDLDDNEDDGIRMNSQSSSSAWKRFDKDTFIGPNNEIRTKHDPELKHRSNAADLLGSHGAKLKVAETNSVAVSDRAYNAFKRAESRQSGFKKGVAKQGHGRAEDAGAGKTRGGAMDGNVRMHIAAAINAGLIDRCNGVVKEGKEAMVYHADGGWKGRRSRQQAEDDDGGGGGAEDEISSVVHYSGEGALDTVGSDGYDVAVKVFKRMTEFKGRGTYVDGDSRYHKQKFKTNDQRDQVVLWTEKEYRNLIRAYRAGVPVPKPLYRKENILFLRFLGENGWPSPQIKEIDMKKGSKKWTTLYAQTLVAVRRLYHCARLIHADLSEYNILICPTWQASHGHLITSDERTADDETLQVVLIDFGQSVEIGHPSAAKWLGRDLSTVRDFFVKQGIKALPNEDAERYVTDPFEEVDDAENGETGINEMEVDLAKTKEKDNNWRHTKRGWDDEKEMEILLEKLKGTSR